MRGEQGKFRDFLGFDAALIVNHKSLGQLVDQDKSLLCVDARQIYGMAMRFLDQLTLGFLIERQFDTLDQRHGSV